MPPRDAAALLIDCRDRKALVARVSRLLYAIINSRDSLRAVRWQLGRRVLRYGNKTVVFDWASRATLVEHGPNR